MGGGFLTFILFVCTFFWLPPFIIFFCLPDDFFVLLSVSTVTPRCSYGNGKLCTNISY